jgi:hypothetical protein
MLLKSVMSSSCPSWPPRRSRGSLTRIATRCPATTKRLCQARRVRAGANGDAATKVGQQHQRGQRLDYQQRRLSFTVKGTHGMSSRQRTPLERAQHQTACCRQAAGFQT